MAGLSLKADFSELTRFEDLRRQFPEFSARLLGFIGTQGKIELKEQLLSGKELNVMGSNAFSTNTAGRRMVGHSVVRGGRVGKIFSPIVKLFEYKTYGHGRVVGPGKKILSVKLRAIVDQNIQKWSDEFDNSILQREVDRIIK